MGRDMVFSTLRLRQKMFSVIDRESYEKKPRTKEMTLRVHVLNRLVQGDLPPNI